MSALQEQFAGDAARLIVEALQRGYGVTLGEAWRTPEQAALNAEKGIGVANSLHCERLALDLNLFRNGVWLTDTAPYAEMGGYWKSLGPNHRWGGDFHKPDPDHYSISPDGIRG